MTTNKVAKKIKQRYNKNQGCQEKQKSSLSRKTLKIGITKIKVDQKKTFKNSTKV